MTKRYPVFDWPGSAFESYAKNFVNKNFWRVSDILITREDALQECAAVFVRCKHKYEGQVDNAAWMMSLYKTALAFDWNSKSIRSSRYRETQKIEFTRQQICMSDANVSHGGPLAVALAQASVELRDLTHAILNAPSELLSIIFANDDTESISRRAKRMFRISGTGSRDLMGELRELLMNVEDQ